MDDHASKLPKHQERQRLGFLKGDLKIPADFDRMGEEQIRDLFERKSSEPPSSPEGKP